MLLFAPWTPAACPQGDTRTTIPCRGDYVKPVATIPCESRPPRSTSGDWLKSTFYPTGVTAEESAAMQTVCPPCQRPGSQPHVYVADV